jgi:2'-5' RNA ligase
MAWSPREKSRAMADTWRLFVAVELPRDVLAGLTAVQTALKAQTPPRTVRWVNTEGIHLTLKFLGDTPSAKGESLEAALQQAAEGHSTFSLATGTVGCFPNVRRPRVVWVSIQKDVDALNALRDSVEEHIAPLGYPTEDRPFSPHLTLGRVNRDARQNDVRQFGELIANTTVADIHEWQVTAVSLIRSELKPSGAVYTPLFRAQLIERP